MGLQWLLGNIWTYIHWLHLGKLKREQQIDKPKVTQPASDGDEDRAGVSPVPVS